MLGKLQHFGRPSRKGFRYRCIVLKALRNAEKSLATMTTSVGLATIGADQLLNGVASRLIFEGPPCESWPCWNEGECIPNGTRSYTCVCQAHFAGRHCQFRKDHHVNLGRVGMKESVSQMELAATRASVKHTSPENIASFGYPNYADHRDVRPIALAQSMAPKFTAQRQSTTLGLAAQHSKRLVGHNDKSLVFIPREYLASLLEVRNRICIDRNVVVEQRRVAVARRSDNDSKAAADRAYHHFYRTDGFHQSFKCITSLECTSSVLLVSNRYPATEPIRDNLNKCSCEEFAEVNFARWEEGDISEDEDDLIALGIIRKGNLRMSQTTETIIETEPPCGSSQQIDIVDL
ncbi:EGF-like domain protein [Teladorsagia circumcincta]|uniref:EGF-like domain protein n=1 Tax=Teladorsagia circumcincta TaxID=45464 RepID=A0A2G9UCB7_TELCI|nr:EGF-like domain protein [Teladorsagia circumcincta]